jgi:hypothetical protein
MRSISAVTEDLPQLFKKESAQWSQLVTSFYDGNKEVFKQSVLRYVNISEIFSAVSAGYQNEARH